MDEPQSSDHMPSCDACMLVVARYRGIEIDDSRLPFCALSVDNDVSPIGASDIRQGDNLLENGTQVY